MGFNVGRFLGNMGKGIVNYGTPIGWQTMAAGAIGGKPGLRATDMAVPYAEGAAALGATALGVPPGMTAPLAADAARRGMDVWNNSGKPQGVGKGEGIGKDLTSPYTGPNRIPNNGLGAAGAWSPQSPSWLSEQGGSSIPGIGDYGNGSTQYSSSTGPVRPSAPSAQEQEHSRGVSDMARLLSGQGQNSYNVSSPLYGQAVDYYNKILSGDKGAAAQAIAPEAEAMAELNAGRMKGIQQSGARGGARDQALEDASRQAHGDIASLIPKARQNAAQAGSQLALQGMGLGTQQEGAAAGLYSDLLGKGQQDRQFGDSLQQQNAQMALQEKLGMRGLDVQQMGLKLQEKLGMRGLDLQAMTSMNTLQLQRELGLMNINLSQQQVALLQQEMRDKKAEAGGQAIGNIGSMVINGLGMLLGGKIGGGGSKPAPTVPSSGGSK